MKRILLSIAFSLAFFMISTTTMAQKWVGTWATAPQLVEPHNLPPQPGLSENSLRQIVQVSIGGKMIRVKFSNEYGKTSLDLRSVEIALARDAGASSEIQKGTTKKLTFHGKKAVLIEPGAMATSDPIKFKIGDRANLAITIHYGKCDNKIVTGHPGSRTTSYLAEGYTSEFVNAKKTDHWYTICGIDVIGKSDSRAVAILGNSITDGRGSTTNHQNRWADNLSRHLLENETTHDVAVLNLGIGGNCVVRGGLGPCANNRYKRDILDQAGVKYVIVFEGTNDICWSGNGEQTANELIDSYKAMITEAHKKGMKIYGATITPFKGNGNYNEDRSKAHEKVNEWIRTSGQFDAVIDFDKVMRDPENPLSLQKRFLFENDYLHPNAEGYKVMGASIDLKLFE